MKRDFFIPIYLLLSRERKESRDEEKESRKREIIKKFSYRKTSYIVRKCVYVCERERERQTDRQRGSYETSNISVLCEIK